MARPQRLKMDYSDLAKAVKRYNLQLSLGRRRLAPEIKSIIPPDLDLEAEIQSIGADRNKYRRRIRELQELDFRQLVRRATPVPQQGK